ncbi:MAG: hypothetical protein ACKOD9_10100, partial [Rubrivivax sp.]
MTDPEHPVMHETRAMAGCTAGLVAQAPALAPGRADPRAPGRADSLAQGWANSPAHGRARTAVQAPG